MQKRFQSNRLRTGRASIIGQAYHLRFSLHNHQRHLTDFHIARAVVQALARETQTNRAETLCFCVMPDHVHWLMILQAGTLGRCIHNVKRLSQHIAQSRIPWQRSFFDRGIRDEKNLRSTARYIVANPLRANLVSSIGDYPHWDAVWLDGESINQSPACGS